MRIETAAQVQRGVQLQAAEFGQARLAEVQAGRHEFDVTLFQGIVDHLLAFVHQNRTGRIDQVATAFRVCVQRIDGGQQKLLLQIGVLFDVILVLVKERVQLVICN